MTNKPEQESSSIPDSFYDQAIRLMREIRETRESKRRQPYPS